MNPSFRDYLQKSLTLPYAHVIHKILSALDVLGSNSKQRKYVKESKMCQTLSKPFIALDLQKVRLSPRQPISEIKFSK